MAGVKGRSGGARPNAGGARPNSGPKPKTTIGPVEITPLEQIPNAEQTPLEFLLQVMRSPHVDDKTRLEAAKTAAQYCHLKKGDGGVKDEKAEKAKKAGMGKFAAAAAPKLIVNNR
jgi:phage terminase small subunit